MQFTNPILCQWGKAVLIFICLSAFVTGCAGDANSKPTQTQAESEVALRHTPPSVSPSPTSTLAIASTSDVISMLSPTSPPKLPPTPKILSDTLNLTIPTFTPPLPTPTSTIPSIQTASPTSGAAPDLPHQPTSLFESPLPPPPPASLPTSPPEPTQSPPTFLSPLETPTPTVTTTSDLATLEKEMIRAVNQERLAHELPPYQVDEKLTAIAQAHAQDMARQGYMSHVTLEGKTYTDRLGEAGFTPHWRGENIVLSVRPANEAVQDSLKWWMNSAPHRHNVLHPYHTHIGVGVAQTPKGWYVFVMDLMKP